ncbi:DUF4340 domain-containing protein [Paenibacillus sp. y28]|uniref:DUF4340 domain-containing protein n=1 Tax=Paenibacillus sp. y28 TaxID=3129110 RepID=UPI003016FFD2
MKRYVPTLLLVIVCVAGFWYASGHSFFKKEDENAPQAYNTLQKDAITAISIHTGMGDVELERQGEAWQMVKPQAVPLNRYGVDDWLDSFTGLMHKGIVDSEPADLEPFGLKEPPRIFTVKTADGSTRTLRVGTVLPVPDYLYAKWQDRDEVVKLSTSAIDPLTRTALDFMDTTVFQFSDSDVVKLEVEYKGSMYSLQNKADSADGVKWQVGETEWKPEDAGTLFGKLHAIATQELVKPAGEVALSKPDLKVTIQMKEKSTVYVGQVNEGKLWVAQEQGPWAFSLPVATADEIVKLFQQAPAAAG